LAETVVDRETLTDAEVRELLGFPALEARLTLTESVVKEEAPQQAEEPQTSDVARPEAEQADLSEVAEVAELQKED
ncbi:hypothetical protein CSB45_15875, partial [candidate division KSB3 bacterium]